MTRARDLADYISTGVSDTELDVLDGVTAGTVTASKALVVDANKDVASLRNITATGTITGNVTGDVTGDVTGNLTGNVTGNTSGSSGSTTGNAATATALATARTIGGVSFDGTGNINLPGVNTSGNQDTSGNAATATTAGTVTTAAQTNITSLGTLTTLTVDDITIDGSTISDGGDFTLDVGGEITIDSDSGVVRFKDGGTQYGLLAKSGSNFIIKSQVSDGDLIIRGVDGGSEVDALTFDMSDAGSAVFNNHAYISDNSKLIFGASADLQIYHSTADAASIITDQGTGPLAIQSNLILLQNSGGTANLLKATEGGAVELLYGNSTKCSTTANGINVAGDVVATNDIYVANDIIHQGDGDTYITFDTNSISIYTGGTYTNFQADGVFISDGSLAEDYDALSGTTPTCNVTTGGMFSLTMSGNTTFTFSGASSGYIQGFVLQLTGNGGTVTYPNTVDWAGGTAPDAPANGETDILVFITRDGGSNWYGALALDAAG